MNELHPGGKYFLGGFFWGEMFEVFLFSSRESFAEFKTNATISISVCYFV